MIFYNDAFIVHKLLSINNIILKCILIYNLTYYILDMYVKTWGKGRPFINLWDS